MFLSDSDLEALTGYRRPADQRRWLSGHGWIFEISRTGRPSVLSDYARNKLSGVEAPRMPVLRTAHLKA